MEAASQNRALRQLIPMLPIVILLVGITVFNGCKKEEPDEDAWKEANSTCLTSACHGNPNLVKNVPVTGGAIEKIPLFVDSTDFVATDHKGLLCTSCHTDITMNNGMHGKASKIYGGWARFSQKSGSKALANSDSTRNYGTQASVSCAACHEEQGNENAAHVKIPRLRSASIRDFQGHKVGEAYEDDNCSRCHATCATCHFKSDITPKAITHTDILIQSNWDGIQTSGDNFNGVNWSDATEWRMDCTANVKSHNFRNKEELNGSNDVCKSCHIGYYRPAQKGFAMRNGELDSMYATGIKRHPQFQELSLGSVHQNSTCGSCHGASLHQQESIEGGPECVDCHSKNAANHPSINHMNLSAGVKIKCISCHTNHRASDFGGAGQSNWINPEITNQKLIVPVTVKYSELLNWYPHMMSKSVNCTALCHFDGNRVGAHTMGNVSIPVRPAIPYKINYIKGVSDE